MSLPPPTASSAPTVAAAVAPWYRQCAQRFCQDWLLKALGNMGFLLLFFWAYLHVLRHPAFPVAVMPLTWVDAAVGFRPWALWFYLSLWFYTALPPALVASRRELFGYGAAIFAVCAVGVACFVAWPTAVPTPDIDWALYPSFAPLKGVDGAGNACPSLHVASAAFSALWLDALLRQTGAGRAWRLLNVLWCAGIVYSTLAVKQHVALDAAAGLLLGLGGGLLSRRWVPAWAARGAA